MGFVRTEWLEVLRVTEGDFDLDTGETSADTSHKVKVAGSIQPVSGETIQRLPEGIKTSAEYSVWTMEGLNKDDLIIYKGETYRVFRAQDWDQASSAIRHYKYVMIRTTNQGHNHD